MLAVKGVLTSPTMALNADEYLTLLEIPDGQKIAAVLLVGKASGDADAASSATTRNDFADVTTILG